MKIMKNKKSQLRMSGSTFNECWDILGIDVLPEDNVEVNFINNTIVNIIVNDEKIWSVISPF